MIYDAFTDELEKIATSVDLKGGGEIKLKPPSMRHLSAMRDPGSAGFIKPKFKMRISGGAKKLGVRRPATLSSGRSAIGRAKLIRSAAGRRPMGMPVGVPTV